jgi:Uncharacterized conserved protein
MIYFIASAGILILLIGYIISTYNRLVSNKNSLDESFSTMDVYLKKRWDLIPNLVETVKGYAKHEKDLFKEVTELRSKSYQDLSIDEKNEINKRLTTTLNKLIAVAENYPELKANENFLDLSHELKNTEQDIANARKYYNANVKVYNNQVMIFPSNIIAKIFKFEKASMFEIEETERQNVKVEF